VARSMVVLLAAAVLGGCGPGAATAPETLSELAGFLFAHMMDDDPAELDAGVENLVIWLDANGDQTVEGYNVLELDPATIEAVTPNRDSELGSVGGASVGAEIFHDVDPIARALVLDEQEDIFEQYLVHERTYASDPACFMARDPDCLTLTTDNYVESKFAGIVNVTTKSRAQFRFVDLADGGTTFLHRTWLTEPTSAGELATIHDQLYFGITIPWEGHAFRLGTTWMNADILSGIVTEEAAMKEMINAMGKEAFTIDAYLLENTEQKGDIDVSFGASSSARP